MEDSTALIDILHALHRLELHIQTQNARLDTIELSVSGEPSPDALSLVCSHPRTQDGKLNDLQVLGQEYSCKEEFAIGVYEASICKLRKRFEFADDSDSESNLPSEERMYHAHGDSGEDISLKDISQSMVKSNPLEERCHSAAFSKDECDDGRSISIYTTEALASHNMLSETLNCGIFEKCEENGQQNPESSMLSQTAYPQLPKTAAVGTGMGRRRSWRFSRKIHRSRRASSTRTTSTSNSDHERVMMTFFAYDNFKESLRSSKSFRSEEKRAARDEIGRLKLLADLSGHERKKSLFWTMVRGWLSPSRLYLGRMRASA